MSDRTPLLTANGASSEASSTRVDEDEDVEDDEDDSDGIVSEELYVHPGELRGNIVRAAHDAGYGATTGTPKKTGDHSHGGQDTHDGHAHGQEEEEHAAGHEGQEGSMNMRGVFLHVLGDAVSVRELQAPEILG